MGKAEALFSPIRGHASFKDQAVELLTDRIMSGKIKPGERLNESSLSQQLRISRAPIREALQQLQEQGLVLNIPRRGMFVVSLGKDDVQKINSLRLVLESEALRLARTYITPQKVKKLGQLMKQIEDAKPAPTNESVRLDVEFHRTIWSSTGNEYLEKTLTSLTAPLFAHRMVDLRSNGNAELRARYPPADVRFCGRKVRADCGSGYDGAPFAALARTCALFQLVAKGRVGTYGFSGGTT